MPGRVARSCGAAGALGLLLSACPVQDPLPTELGPFDAPWPLGDPGPSPGCPEDGDSDGDRVADCGPALAAALAPCPEEGWACCVRGVLAVDDVLTERGTDDPGSLDLIDSWPGFLEDASGPEFTYLFVAEEPDRVFFRLEADPAADLHVHAWPATGATCDPFDYAAAGDDDDDDDDDDGGVLSARAALSVEAAHLSRWYVVVDGGGQPAEYELSVTRSPW